MAEYLQETKDLRYPTIYIEIKKGGETTEYYRSEETDYEDLRTTEQGAFIYSSTKKTDGQTTKFTVIYSIKVYQMIEGIIGLCRTTFICIVLAIGSIFFSSDANHLVLNPIERMLEKVKFIAKNPLAAATDEVDQAGMMSLMHKEQTKGDKDKKGGDDAEYETQILEKAIVKIGHLLAIGFGEAGSKIIADNMTEGGDLNPMMPGVKTFGIFGFSNIRAFMDITEVL
jgi:hypothetical protein